MGAEGKRCYLPPKKADNFIRYNSDEILEENDKAPVRSYFCEMCGGFHVTSNPSRVVGKKLDQRDRQRIESVTTNKNRIKEFKLVGSTLLQRLEKIQALLFYGETVVAEDLLDICDLDIKELSSYPVQGSSKLSKLREKVEKMFKLLSVVKGLLNHTEDGETDFTPYLDLDVKKDTLKIINSNIIAIRRIDTLLAENHSALKHNSADQVDERINEIRELMSKIHGAWKKKKLQKYNAVIQDQGDLLKMIKIYATKT